MEGTLSKFGRTRNAVGTRAAGQCFHSKRSRVCFHKASVFPHKLSRVCSISFKNHRDEKRGFNFDYQNVNYLCSRHHYVNSSCYNSVSPSGHTNTIFNQSARVFSKGCFLNIYMYSFFDTSVKLMFMRV